jgi:bifunctional DNA-binding transcriptional regulator/antitoxin component of YhaV-PrlF toxin-antitoxin module
MKGKIHRDVTVSNHGRLTLPATIRRAMNLDGRRRVRVSFAKRGEVFIRLLPDVMSYFGSLKNHRPYDPKEKRTARHAMGSSALLRR